MATPNTSTVSHNSNVPVQESSVEDDLGEHIDEEEEDDNIISKLIGRLDLQTNAQTTSNIVLQDGTTLRNYQLELASDAVQGHNTIVLAETGTGKTLVAAYVIQKHFENAVAGGPERKVAFMAPTGSLVAQQCVRLKKHLPKHETKQISGDDEYSSFMDAFLGTQDVLCFTPQILINNIEKGNVLLSSYSLLLLDECHHTSGNAPYAVLMRKYLTEKTAGANNLPQIVGMTASIGVGGAKNDSDAVEHIIHVCARLDTVRLTTVEKHKADIEKYINKPKEETVHMDEKKDDQCKKVILAAMEKINEQIEELVLDEVDLLDIHAREPKDRESQAYNNWTVDLIKAAQQLDGDGDAARSIGACAMYLNVYNSALEVNNLLQTKDIIKYMADKLKSETRHKEKLTENERQLLDKFKGVQRELLKLSKDTRNPNVEKLKSVLREELFKAKDVDSKAIVFVKARATCKALASHLNDELGKQFDFRTVCLFGKESKAGDDGMTESEQTDVLEKFRSDNYKIMVCTSVGTEGIDVPDCNIVINYNSVGNEITKIQMKGRSRRKGGSSFTFGDAQQREKHAINAYKSAMMYRAIERFKTEDRNQIQRKVVLFQRKEEDLLKFQIAREKAKVAAKSEDNLEMSCKRCKAFACFASDLRKLDSHYLVIDNAFPDRVEDKPLKKRGRFDGLETTKEMICKKCPNIWGHVARSRGSEIRMLKAASFRFVNQESGTIADYKKWIDVPYKVPEVQLQDIPMMFPSEEGSSMAE